MLEHRSMQQYPKTTDPLVQALQRLLEREGGHVSVGDAAGINDQSLYQIANCKPDSKTGKPKGVGPSIRNRLSERYPGWHLPPITGTASITLGAVTAQATATAHPPTPGVAHGESLLIHTVTSLKSVEDVLSAKTLEEEFRFALPDDAMAPDHPRGLHIIFSTTRPAKPGRLVLVQIGDDQLQVRRYTQGRTADHWLAVPDQPRGYASYDSAVDNLRIRGVMRGTYDAADD